MRSIRALPKAHLHVHLEGTIRPTTLLDIAQRHGAPAPQGLHETARYAFTNLAAFFVDYQRVRDCLQDPEDFQRIAYELCQDEAAQGVRYAEVTFSPAYHALRLGDWDMPIMAILEGFARGEEEFGIQCRLILDHSRRRPYDLAQQTLRTAVRYRDKGVIGLGLGGPEADYPPEPFAPLFLDALDAGLHSLPHAGEEAGPPSIRGALDALKAERLGHGVRVLEDPDLTAEVRERQIPLEVCPSINIATGIFGSLNDHPLPKLLEAGLLVTLNADVPAMTGSPIGNEFALARATFGLDDAALAKLARASVHASFMDAGTKAQLDREIEEWSAEGEGFEPSRGFDSPNPLSRRAH